MQIIDLLKLPSLALAGDVTFEGLGVLHRYGREQALKAEMERDAGVLVIIASLGGSSAASIAGRDLVQMISTVVPVMVLALGACHSAANNILTAVPQDRRFATPAASFMIHQPQRNFTLEVAGSQAAQNELLKEELRSLEYGGRLLEQSIEYVSEPYTRLPRKRVEEMMRHATYFGAEEAKEWGFIGGIIRLEPELGGKD